MGHRRQRHLQPPWPGDFRRHARESVLLIFSKEVPMRKFRSSKAVRFAAGAVIDTLESRRLLSTVSVSPNGDGTNTLNAIGTNGNDNLYLFDNANSNFVEVVDDKNHDGIADASEVFLFDQD